MPLPPNDMTTLLSAVERGGDLARTQLLDRVYVELRELASSHLRRERPDHTLQPTALVHEAYLKLIGQNELSFRSRAEFFGAAAQVMRRILVDHARRSQAAKRGGGRVRETLDTGSIAVDDRAGDLLEIDDALRKFADTDPERARIVELRFFGGLSNAEAGEILGVSTRSVERAWRVARAWLLRELGASDAST